MPQSTTDREALPYVRRHLRFGWWSLLGFMTLGVGLESMHGFKVGWYLDVANETRRLMFTLGHAHGALLGLVHLGFAATAQLVPAAGGAWRVASPCLIGASILLPGGFFLGGLVIHAADPNLSILLVPPGAALLLTAAFASAWAVTRRPPP